MSVPLVLTSSSLPIKGVHQSPALAASRACAGEKHSVTLTRIPSAGSFRVARKPSGINGTLTTMF